MLTKVPTEQELFNKIAKHLLRQNARSVDKQFCQMKDPQGRRCAVGCLINPAKFETWMNKATSAFALRYLLEQNNRQSVLSETLKTHELFLNELQRIHDQMMPNTWRKALEIFAREHKLKMVEGFDGNSKEKSST